MKHDKHLSYGLIEDVQNYLDDNVDLHYYEKPLLKFLRQLRSGESPKLSSLILKDSLVRNLGIGKIHTHSHHLSHAAAGFQTSPFDRATVVVIDAIGEWDTISIWDARYIDGKAKYKKLWSQKYPHSIGLFYSAMTKRAGQIGRAHV